MTLSKEELHSIIDSDHVQCGDAAIMARELLERRERDGQEPVAWMQVDGDSVEYNGHNEFSGGGKGTPLYAAPPAPVATSEPVRYMNRFTGACFTQEQQPDAATDTAVYVPLYAENLGATISNSADIAIDEASQVTAALNQTHVKQASSNGQSFGNSEQLNSPVIPDGWIKCSERLPSANENVYLANTEYPEMKGRVFVGWLESGKHQHFFIGNQLLMKATHWMKIGISMPRTPQQEEL